MHYMDKFTEDRHLHSCIAFSVSSTKSKNLSVLLVTFNGCVNEDADG